MTNKKTTTPNYTIDSYGNLVPTKGAAGKLPAQAKSIMREHEWTEAELRDVLDQLAIFADIDKRGRPTTEGYWIASTGPETSATAWR